MDKRTGASPSCLKSISRPLPLKTYPLPFRPCEADAAALRRARDSAFIKRWITITKFDLICKIIAAIWLIGKAAAGAYGAGGQVPIACGALMSIHDDKRLFAVSAKPIADRTCARRPMVRILMRSRRLPEQEGPMPGAVDERFDFFLSRRGSVAAVAQEVSDVLTAAGYKVFVQDYDIPLGASFVEAMHEGGQERARPHHPVHRRLRTLALHPQGIHQLRGRAAARRAGPSHRRPALRRCAAPGPSGRRRLSGPRRRRRARGAQTPHPCGGGAPLVGRAAATQTGQDVRRRPAAHRGFHRPRGRTRPARRHSHPGQARRRDPGRPGGACRAWAGSERRRSPSNTPTASANSMTGSGGVRRKRAPAS